MNKLIKALAEQAAHDTRNAHNNAYWRIQDEMAEDVTWREKFAELLQQDCLQHLINTGQDHAREILERYFGTFWNQKNER